jgi:uncharacterized protein (DUF3820 family)
MRLSEVLDQLAKDAWQEVDMAKVGGPRPDLEMPWAKACSNCKGTRLIYIQKTLANGPIQFRHVCQDCSTRSEALPYARDLDSMGATVIPFGKHKGKTLQEIEATAPDYLDWYLGNGDNVKLLGTIVLFRRLASPAPVARASVAPKVLIKRLGA